MISLVNYTFFNGSNILSSFQNDSNVSTTLTIEDTIDISSLVSGNFNLNVTCINGVNTQRQQFNIEIDKTNPLVVTAISDNTPVVSDVIQLNSTCSDSNGISLLAVENNATGSFINVTTVSVTNQTPFLYLHNHTVVLGEIAHRVTCQDAVSNSIQSALIPYNSSATPPAALPEATGYCRDA